ncbi:MAG: sulfatase [Ruminococcus sp.]|jgi:arylsulfatase A-like enzyme
MKAILILCDTVNRRMLESYGAREPAYTPNLNRLAHKSMVFDSHWCGSAPCMPARKDIMTGRLSFLEKPWGGMEPYDLTLQQMLKEKNVHSMLFSDHAHYLIPGGENYTKGFTAWDVYRGQEGDPWCVQPDKSGIRLEKRPEGWKGEYSESEAANRRQFKTEYDYPSVKTMYHAASWLEENHEADNYFLWVESFDPHEPYDVPKHYLDLYEKEGEYEGIDFNHPDYQPNIFTEEETKHLRNKYKALLTMTDRHIGEILDVMDKYDMWKDTMVIFTTDHGFHLGEHGLMAKNYMAPYNEVFHIPLMIYHPDIQPGRCGAVTQNTDLMLTLMEYFGVDETILQYPVHGKSVFPLLKREKEKIRDGAVFGYFGKQVGYTDGRYTYFRAAKDESNRPLYLYTAIPSMLRQYLGANDGVNVEDYDKIEMGRYLSWTNYPVYRFPADIIMFHNTSQEFYQRSIFNQNSLLFDLETDYAQEHPIQDEELEKQMIAGLKKCMADHDSPAEQYERLGI